MDGYMNIALEKTEEYVDGVKRRSYGDAFVRGNNGRSFLPTSTAWPSSMHGLTDKSSHVHLCRLRSTARQTIAVSGDDTVGALQVP